MKYLGYIIETREEFSGFRYCDPNFTEKVECYRSSYYVVLKNGTRRVFDSISLAKKYIRRIKRG